MGKSWCLTGFRNTSLDSEYERWKLHRASMKTVLSMGEYDDYSLKRLLLTSNWLRKPSFIHVSIYSHWRQGRLKRKRVSETEWHILILQILLMMPQPEGNKWWPFVYNPSRYFSSVNFIQTLSKYTFFKPIWILKDLLRERRIFKI